MENFGELEIKTKEELFESLMGKRVRITSMDIEEKFLTSEEFVFEYYKNKGSGLLVSSGEGLFRKNFVWEKIIYEIVELSSGKIVFQNPNLLADYNKNISRKEIVSRAFKGHFCYGKENPLE